MRIQFEKRADSPLAKSAEAVVEMLKRFDRGQTVMHAEIEDACGYKRGTMEWNAIVARVKRAMLDGRRIKLFNEPRVGYRLLTVDETQTEYVAYETRKQLRATGRKRKAVAAMATLKLSIHQRRANNALADGIAEERREILRKKRLYAVIGKPSEAGPKVRRERVQQSRQAAMPAEAVA